MILQLMIRKPDEDLENSIIVGVLHSKEVCLELIKSLMEDIIPSSIAKLCFSFYPSGFIIEGVAYGEVEEDPIEAFDLYLKVLH